MYDGSASARCGRPSVGITRNRFESAVEEHDLARRLDDLGRRAHARHALRLAVERRVEDALLVREVFHLREQLRLVLRLVRRGRAPVDRQRSRPVKTSPPSGFTPLSGSSQRTDSPGFTAGGSGADAPDAVEIDFAVAVRGAGADCAVVMAPASNSGDGGAKECCACLAPTASPRRRRARARCCGRRRTSCGA